MSRSNRIALFRRAKPKFEPKRKFLLVCEGKRTEPEYFEAVQQTLDRTLIGIEIERGAGTPDAIAQRAITILRQSKRGKLNSFEKKDEVWAVFDRDEHHHFDAAVAACEAAGVKIARSNPCFEIWLILHIESWDKPDGRHAVQSRLEEILDGYNSRKNKSADFSKIVQHIASAEERAAVQLKNREKEGCPFGAPCTTVHELTIALRAEE